MIQALGCVVSGQERERGWSCNQATEMLMEHHTDTEKTKYHMTFRFQKLKSENVTQNAF